MIGKDTADLIIHYAEEDMELVKAGTFTMVCDDGAFGTKDMVKISLDDGVEHNDSIGLNT